MKLNFLRIFLIFCLCFFINPVLNIKAQAVTQIQNVPVNIQQEISKQGATIFYKTVHGTKPAYFLYINNSNNFDIYKVTDKILKFEPKSLIWIYNNKFDTTELNKISDVYGYAIKKSPVYMISASGKRYNPNTGKTIGQDSIYKINNNKIVTFCKTRGAFSNWKWQDCKTGSSII